MVELLKVILVGSLGKVFKQCCPVEDGRTAAKDIFRASPIWRGDSSGDCSKSGLLWRGYWRLTRSQLASAFSALIPTTDREEMRIKEL